MTDETGVTQSPLAEADPASLDELFQRFDEHIKNRTLNLPAAHTTTDLVRIELLRQQREHWSREAEAGQKPRAKRMKSSSVAAVTQQTLGDIGLD